MEMPHFDILLNFTVAGNSYGVVISLYLFVLFSVKDIFQARAVLQYHNRERSEIVSGFQSKKTSNRVGARKMAGRWTRQLRLSRMKTKSFALPLFRASFLTENLEQARATFRLVQLMASAEPANRLSIGRRH